MSDTEGRSHPSKTGGTVVYRSTEDLERTELSTAVLTALGSVPGYDLEDGDTVVFDHIDLDALDELFGHASTGDSRGRVTFPIDGYRVTATAGGEITVRA